LKLLYNFFAIILLNLTPLSEIYFILPSVGHFSVTQWGSFTPMLIEMDLYHRDFKKFETKSSFITLFDQIKSLRKEYGTPVTDNQDLNQDQSSEDSESGDEEPWKDVKVKINNNKDRMRIEPFY